MTNETKNQIKHLSFVFILGATFGMIVEQAIMLHTIKKDCEVIGAFRISDTPYHCKPSIK